MNPLLRYVDSPLGRLRLLARAAHLSGLYLPAQPEVAGTEGESPVLDQAERELSEYFAGTRRVFEVPVACQGTEFQRAVWSALVTIAPGEQWTYGRLAAELGRPGAARAVGAANGQNPVSIVVPCHRLVGSDGALRGYAGGLDAKRWLLKHEEQWRA